MLERRSPLPRGVYWCDMFEPPVGGASVAAFRGWIAEHSPARVRVRSSVWHGPGEHPLASALQYVWPLSPALAAIAYLAPASGSPARLWTLFEVLAPVPWPSRAFGYPTIAPRGASTTEDDTVQRPDPTPELADRVADAMSASASAAPTLMTALALAAGGVLALRMWSRA